MLHHHHIALMINRFQHEPASVAHREGRAHYPIAIRRARDSDALVLHDLAEVDSAAPLRGAVLVAVVEGRIWAALELDGERVIADPFLPSAPAVQLLRLRVDQLRAAEGTPQRRRLPRWVARRARA